MLHPDLLDLTNALHPNFAKLQVGHLQHKDLDEPLSGSTASCSSPQQGPTGIAHAMLPKQTGTTGQIP